MSRPPYRFHAGQSEQGRMYYFAAHHLGIHIWGIKAEWTFQEGASLKEAAQALNLKKLERLTPADLPLFMLRQRPPDEEDEEHVFQGKDPAPGARLRAA